MSGGNKGLGRGGKNLHIDTQDISVILDGPVSTQSGRNTMRSAVRTTYGVYGAVLTLTRGETAPAFLHI